ncbi:hypothetical protein [Rubrobacter indicoceani]|uniref:hypothetical protein n=1 Tax=Rubrobacter indicoceani TaxID=2051957 RepID=UPI000E5AE021|nr:hypothetical protein [Rubrobacter indicoceani]
MDSHRTFIIALTILVAAFVALYPYFGSMDFCERGECPYAMTQASHGNSAGLVSACAVAALAALSAGMLAPALSSGRRLFVSSRWATQFHISLDPPPPRLSFQAA